jgi:non-canonical purine NTP pyrophosphatase (RdgB/HAM1 family)/o-succinylbenzoate synthase
MAELRPIEGLKLEVISRPLIFKKPAKTSRNVLVEKPCYFLKATDASGKTALGECSLIPGLSLESEEDALSELNRIANGSTLSLNEVPQHLPAVRFAVETLLMELHNSMPFTKFTKAIEGLEINGLVWMGDMESMLKQVDDLKARGFKTIKLKVGAFDFEKELELLREIRRRCPAEEYCLRVDANGAFKEDALEKLAALEEFQLHSIEQPIPAGNTLKMKELCSRSPVPIALDEELIGVRTEAEKAELLDQTKPAYLVIKPSLIGGLAEAKQWIELAESRSIGWWITSALESNVGLKAIADFTSWMMERSGSKDPIVSGLGTGSLYTNNMPSNMGIVDGALWTDVVGEIEIEGRSWTLDAEGASAFAEDDTRASWTDGIAEFLEYWFLEDGPMLSNTSGSTGEPQSIEHSRTAVINSATETLEYFDLKTQDRVILALPINFVAGKMMLVRAIVGRLRIEAVEPGLNEVWVKYAKFAALTPHQCSIILSKHSTFPPTSKLLLGGSPVGIYLLDKLPEDIDVFEGYGMTETLTHVALRKISGSNLELPFEALEGITFESTPEGTLIINAPSRSVHSLVSDDQVELHSTTSFTWLGRHSDIINSGGIKFNPAHLEERLHTVISHDLAIYGLADPDLGQTIALRINSPDENFDAAIKSVLSGKEIPRHISFGPIKRNKAGKILRKEMDKTLPIIVFATGNQNKAKEVARLLEGKFTVKSLPEIGCTEDIPETSDTLEGNAALKARYVKDNYGYDCFADDTGLEVKAFGGAPGVHTARYGGPEKDAQINMNHLLSELKKADSEDRTARFRTAIHLIVDGKELSLEGICRGAIAMEQSGFKGFGYDPIFIPDGEFRTFSEMSADEKNKISHRGLVIREMLDYLSSLH